MQLFSYVRQCLATEMRLVQAANGEALSGLANLMISNSGAEVLHKIDILRRRTQVHCFRQFFLYYLNIKKIKGHC